MTSSSNAVSLTPQLMSSFRPSKVFKDKLEAGKCFTSFSFDDSGTNCVTAGEDENLQLFSCRTGRHQKTLASKKYGADLARFTHKNSAVIYASRKADDTIRYLSTHDNQYLQYFRGHKKKVVSLEMSPVDDTFLSAAVDDTIRVWDLRTDKCQGALKIMGHPVVAYDQAGLIFAVAISERPAILLYDIKQYEKEPFATFHFDDDAWLSQISFPPRPPIFTSLSFSNDGAFLLVGTAGDAHYLLDAYSGVMRRRLVGHKGLGQFDNVTGSPGFSGQEVTWSPDGKWVLSGSADGNVVAWDVSKAGQHASDITLHPAGILEGHDDASRVVAFNPKTAMFATAGKHLAFWLPEPPKPDDEEA